MDSLGNHISRKVISVVARPSDGIVETALIAFRIIPLEPFEVVEIDPDGDRFLRRLPVPEMPGLPHLLGDLRDVREVDRHRLQFLNPLIRESSSVRHNTSSPLYGSHDGRISA